MKSWIFILITLFLCTISVVSFIWLLFENSKAVTISPFCLRQACSNSEPAQLSPAADPEARSFVHLNYCYSNLPTVEFVSKIESCSRGGNSKDFFSQNIPPTADQEGNVSRIAYYSNFIDWFYQPNVCGYSLPAGNPTRDGDDNRKDQLKFLEDVAKCKVVVES